MDYIIMSAAVAYYTPKTLANNRIKKSDDGLNID